MFENCAIENPPSPQIACLHLNHTNNSLAMRIQKKVLGKLSSRGVVRHLAADRVINLMDKLYTLLNQFYPSRTAEKGINIKLLYILSVMILIEIARK